MYCGTLKDYLEEKGVEYTEKNIGTDPQARQELINKGHMGVPVTVIGDKEIVGFDKVKLDEEFGD